MVTTETEEIVRQQRVNEHKTILDMIALLDKRLSKIEDDKGTARNNAIGDYVQDELKHHCKDAHISQGQVKKWIYEKIEEATNGKD